MQCRYHSATAVGVLRGGAARKGVRVWEVLGCAPVSGMWVAGLPCPPHAHPAPSLQLLLVSKLQPGAVPGRSFLG